MPPAYVKPYVKRGKTDAADAEAICEVVTRSIMRFVSVKTVDQQAALMLHKTRDLHARHGFFKLADIAANTGAARRSADLTAGAGSREAHRRYL